MSEGDSLFSGGLLGPTPNMGGFTQPTMQEFLPQPDELAAERQNLEEEGGHGLLSNIFLGIERLFLGQSIKRGIAESTPGGEGFWHGFISNAPIPGVGDPFRETRFTDIRKAFGWEQTEGENPVGNFFLNMAGEMALSPFELAAAPMGKVGKMFSSSLEGLSAVNPSYFKAVGLGQRALVTMRIPFMGTYLGGTNFGLKSIPLAIGKGMDFVGGVMRTAPVLKQVSSFFTNSAPLFDPEKAAAAKQMVQAYKNLPNELEANFWKIMNQNVDPDTLKWAMKMSAPDRRALLTLQELGLKATDDAGTIGYAVDHADLYKRMLTRERMIKTDKNFSALWSKASDLDKGIRTPEAIDAAKAIYNKYTSVPLPEKWLLEIGEQPRAGAELSLFDQPILTSTGVEAGKTTGDVVRGALSKNKDEIFDLLGRARAGEKVSTDQIQQLLSAHKIAMESIATSESVAGIMNQSFETFAGPYAYRVMARKGLLETAQGSAILGDKAMASMIDPATTNLIHDSFMEGVKNIAGQEGVDAVGRFMQNRKLTDLPTVAANAIAYQVGLKATGHIPLKELEEFGAQGVWAKIFKNKWRNFYKVDPDLGEFFRIFPVHNDLMRYRDSARALQPVAFWREALHPDSTMVLDSFKLSNTESLGKYADDVSKTMVIDTGKGFIFPSLSERTEQFARQEVAASAAVQKYHIRQQVMGDFAEGKQTYHSQMQSLAEQLKLKSSASLDEIEAVRKNGGTQISRAVADLQDAQGRLAAAKELGSKQGIKDAEELIASRKQILTASRGGLQQILDDMVELHQGVTQGFKGEMKATREVFKSKQAVSSAYEDFANAALDAIRGSKNPAQFNDQLVQLFKQRDAGILNVNEARAIELTKRVKLPDGSYGTMPDGNLLDKISQQFPNTTAYVIHKEDADALQQLYTQVSRPDPFAANPIVGFLDRVKAIWSAHTTVNPLFAATRVRDVAQSQAAMAADGLGGMYGHWKAWEAGRALRGAQRGLGKLEETMAGKVVRGLAGDSPMLEVFERMQQRGLIGSSMYRDELTMGAEELAYQMKKGSQATEWVKDIPSMLGLPIRSVDRSPFLQAGYKFAGHLDDHMRTAAVFNAIHKGADIESAISLVEKTLYDSRRMMTNTEKYTIGRLVPFYTFKKYAINRSVNLMMSRPGYASWFDKMQRLSYAAAPLDGSSMDPAVIDTVLPQFIQEGMGIPYRNTPDGPAFALFGSYSTLGDLNQLFSTIDNAMSPDKTVGDSFERYVGMQIHPVLRLAAENALNKEYFSDRVLQKEGETASFFGIDMPRRWRQALRSIRMLNEIDKLNIINASEAQALIAAGRDRQDLPIEERIAGSAFSPVPIPHANLVDVANDYRYRQQKDEMKFSEFKSRLKRQLENAQISGEPVDISDFKDIRQGMIRKAAEMQIREDVKKSYSIDEIMAKRAALVGKPPTKVSIPNFLK